LKIHLFPNLSFSNYPNPFNPVTTIRFAIPEQVFVELKVYDILGREVALLKNEVMAEGFHYVEFDASDLASGIYLYVLKSGSILKAKMLIK
jgi:hypothetical protein